MAKVFFGIALVVAVSTLMLPLFRRQGLIGPGEDWVGCACAAALIAISFAAIYLLIP